MTNNFGALTPVNLTASGCAAALSAAALTPAVMAGVAVARGIHHVPTPFAILLGIGGGALAFLSHRFGKDFQSDITPNDNTPTPDVRKLISLRDAVQPQLNGFYSQNIIAGVCGGAAVSAAYMIGAEPNAAKAALAAFMAGAGAIAAVSYSNRAVRRWKPIDDRINKTVASMTVAPK